MHLSSVLLILFLFFSFTLPFHRLLKPSTTELRTISQNILRTILVLLNVIIAIRAPYFGNMLSAVGGLTDAFLCFVMPPLIYRAALHGEMTVSQNVLYLLLVAGGFLVILYTLYHVAELSMTTIVG